MTEPTVRILYVHRERPREIAVFAETAISALAHGRELAAGMLETWCMMKRRSPAEFRCLENRSDWLPCTHRTRKN